LRESGWFVWWFFMDIDSMPLGIDFVGHVTEQIGRCNAVIVMIGKQWRSIKGKKREPELSLVR
jgi:hypothetical protein